MQAVYNYIQDCDNNIIRILYKKQIIS
jgi:hypothetical protein